MRAGAGRAILGGVRWSGAVLVLTACGRLGFDPIDGGAVAAGDHCQALPGLRGAPTLDGVVERGAALAPVQPVGWSGQQPLPPEVSSAAAIAWWEGGLYFFVDVTDPDRVVAAPEDNPWCGDGVEIYADSDGLYPDAPAYDDPGARQLIARAPSGDVTPEASGAVHVDTVKVGDWSSGLVASPRPGGYTFEAVVTAEDLGLSEWKLAGGKAVGVNLGVNVSVPEATMRGGDNCADDNRLGQYFLRIDDGRPQDCLEPWCNSAAFCSPVLE